MKIGISRPTEGTPQDTLALLSIASRHGYEGVQLKPQQYGEFIDAPARLQTFLGKLAPLASGGCIVYPGGDMDVWIERLAQTISFASAVGGGHVCICGSVQRSDGEQAQHRKAAEILNQIGQMAGEQGIYISLHNHAGCIFETYEDIMRLCETLDPRLCGLTIDTAHAAKGGVSDVAGLIESVKQYVINVHFKDMAQDGTFCLLGTGTLPLDPILQKLTAIDYQGWLIVDEETRSVSHETACEHSMRVVRDLMECIAASA